MYAKSLFTLAFAFCAASSASADNDVYQAEATFAAHQSVSALHIPKPEADRGKLLAMRVEMLVGLRGTAGIENVTKQTRHGVLFNDYGVDMQVGKSEFRFARGGQFALRHDFGAFDGSQDFRGDSGAFFHLQHSCAPQVQRIAGKRLTGLLDSQEGKYVAFNINGGAASNLLGLDDSPHKERLFISVQVKVTYVYEEKSDAAAPTKGPGAGAPNRAKPIGTFGQTAPSVSPGVKPNVVIPVAISKP